jgi:O-antigen/teichoic acid export membrane protein
MERGERPNEPAHPLHEERMDARDVRTRAIAGIAAVALRGVAIRLLAFLGSLALARLLAPRDFGLIAFGATLLEVSSFLSAAGLGAALIRRPQAPGRTELEALLGLQLVATLILAAITAAIGAQLGRPGLVVALMVSSLPLLVVRTPSAILLERRLDFRPLVAVEIAESVLFYAFAVGMVAAGLGVWGFAGAYLIRAAAGSVLMVRAAPYRVVRPRLSLSAVRGLLSFGLKYEAVGGVRIASDQAFNAGTLAIAGLSTLGLWALAKRVLEIPELLFQSLWRVSYPAMSRLVDAGEEPRPLIERAVGLGAVATGAILVTLVGAGPELIPLVFGDKWHEAAEVLPGAAFGIMISGPISVACAGYVYAVGDASTVLRAAVLTNLGILGALPLLPALGPVAFGVGIILGGALDALVLTRAVHRHAGARVVSPLVVPALVATVAGGAGWVAASFVSADLLSVAVGLALAEALYFVPMLLLRRDLLSDTAVLVRRGLRSTVRA